MYTTEIYNKHTCLFIKVWKFMRTTAIGSDKVNCLSMRMDEVPGLDTSLVAKVQTMLSDKSIGIRNDRRYFFASVSKHGSKVTKVPTTYV